MTTANEARSIRIPILQGVLPIKGSQVSAEIMAGITLAAVLAIMAAGFLMLARLIRLGFMATFLSRTVLVGFLTGVGIEVSLGEISGMFGLRGGGHGPLRQIWHDLQQIEQVNFHALAIAVTVLVVILGSKSISNKIPWACRGEVH